MFDQLTERRNLYAACERVRNNGGCRGADGITVDHFDEYLEEEIDRLQDRLLRRVYYPFPLLRIAIPKPTSGMRHLSIPTVRDRVVQTAVDLVTREIFEKEFEDCSHAYRAGRSVRTAIHQIRELRDQGYRWVVDADIDAFFDNIPHERLLARLRRLPIDPYVLALFEKWVRVEIYDGNRVRPLTRGIPQGSVVSPQLANLFLDELDEYPGGPELAALIYIYEPLEGTPHITEILGIALSSTVGLRQRSDIHFSMTLHTWNRPEQYGGIATTSAAFSP